MDSFDFKRLYESIKLVLDLDYKIESLYYDSGSFGNFVIVLQKDKNTYKSKTTEETRFL